MTGDVKRVGRPPLDTTAAGRSPDVHLRLPAAVFDKTVKLAQSKRESVQDTIRRGLRRLLDDERGG